MRRLLVLLLGACSAVPDEVGVGSSATTYSFLGGYGEKPFFETTEDVSYGLSVWGVWKLKPQKVELVHGDVPLDFDGFKPTVPSITIQNEGGKAEAESWSKNKGTTAEAVEVATQVDAMHWTTKLLLGALGLAGIVALFWSRPGGSVLKRLTTRKTKQ